MIVVVAAVSLLSLTVLLWRFGNRPSRILKRCGVPIVPGALPFIGHASEFMKAEHMGAYDCENIKKFGKVHGICEMSLATLVVADPDLLREVLLKQFHLFTDRRDLPLRKWMKLSMLDQKGAEWKRIRAMLTPFFSSAKLKHNLTLMYKPVKSLLQNLQHVYETDNMFDANSISACLSLDVICTTAFGLQIDSQVDSNNQLLTTLKSLSNLSLSSPAIFLSFTFPCLSPIFQFFNISMFPSGYLQYFEKVSKQMIEDRKSSSQTRPDFIQAMVKAHLEDLDYQTKATMYGEKLVNNDVLKRGLTDEEIMAQVLLFFLAGYDTTSKALSFFLYSMALHPDIQEKLYSEITKQIGDQDPNYDNILKLKYLEMCLSESLRLYPPAFRFDRVASKDIVIGGIMIPKDTLVVVPIWAIHRDPELWPSPDKFDPERFSEEVDQLSYLPFGVGLRSCIGSRFAQLELKVAIIEIMRSFKVLTNDHTQVPVHLENAIFIKTKGGIWLSLEPRRKL